MAAPNSLAALVTQAPSDDSPDHSQLDAPATPESEPGKQGAVQSWCRCFARPPPGLAPKSQKMAAVVPSEATVSDGPRPLAAASGDTSPSANQARSVATAQAPDPQPVPQARQPEPNKKSESPEPSPERKREARQQNLPEPAGAHGEVLHPDLPAQVGANIGRKTLVLDLDETLIHSCFAKVPNPDILISVELDGDLHSVFVRKRPGVDEFLIRVAQIYEVVVYTASMAKYANPLLDKLDRHNVVTHRLFREACTRLTHGYTKDLSKLGRDMRSVMLVDNSPICYALQPENGIPIKTWRDDLADRELYDLIPILVSLAEVKDIPAVLRQITWAVDEEEEKKQKKKGR